MRTKVFKQLEENLPKLGVQIKDGVFGNLVHIEIIMSKKDYKKFIRELADLSANSKYLFMKTLNLIYRTDFEKKKGDKK